jgi:uncharacterized protein YodC (DUF2158 family)
VVLVDNQQRGGAMADDFKVGDTVQLNSGGPKMTIDSLGLEHHFTKTQGAHCSWFEGNKKQQAWFVLTSLKKFDAASGQTDGD